MRAIIPVAGFGSRLKPHTYTVPKVLLTVGDKPMLGHIIEKLLEEKIYKATFVIGHLGDMIKNYVEKNYPMLKSDFVTQHEMLGLGHAIHAAIPTFDEEEIFIILGDTIFEVDLKGVFQSKISSLGVKEVEDPSRFGVAVCKDGYIEKLIEKPSTPISKLALVGLYYISNSNKLIEALNELLEKNIKTRGEYQLTDALQIMIDKGERFTTFKVEGWFDCGKPETLLETNRVLLNKIKNNNLNIENVIIVPPSYISPKAYVNRAVIGPYATISEGCRVVDSIIKNSILSPNAIVESSLLESSIIGNNAVVRGNFKKLNAGDSSEIEFF